MAKKRPAPAHQRQYVRFSLSERVQHLIVLLSFTALAITGLTQKYPLHALSIAIAKLWGGVENIRATHHAAAVVLMLVTIYHLIDIGYKVFVLHQRLTMLPSLQDLKDAWMAFTYNVGLGKTRPQMGRYTFDEKAEYWALVWGLLVMGLTGFMMWNPLTAVRFLPGEFIPAAKAAHGAEAVLAVLAIIVWHMYGVHLRRFNRSMWTGRLTEEEMLHEHPLELADIKAGLVVRVLDPATLRKRQRIYYPVATVIALGLLLAVYGFVNAEQTAITTIPPQIATIPVYLPQTPTPLPATPTPLPSPTAASQTTQDSSASPTWTEIGALLSAKCGQCHGSTALGGLNLITFAEALKGGNSGPAVVPGDAANSKLYQVQAAGGHFGQLSADELALLEAWIEAGAPEK